MANFDREQFHALLDRCMDESESLLGSVVSPSSDPLGLPVSAVSVISERVRVRGLRVFEAMGWSPGTAVGFGVLGSVITIGAAPGNRSVIYPRRHVRLPLERAASGRDQAGGTRCCWVADA
ncbi:hypothetical protein [Nocardia brasiliensis]|uniref:hypothetical protein n=1 Tax=Nocardia brasiliensis TaxID=37326 RepID=UPI0018937FFC|nr:hypothetical protein [Nocardia brasiliensis]MBF6126619.1 hypothetical protein [Nocardia brasiliensis]